MAINTAPRDPYRSEARDLTRSPPSALASNAAAFWVLLMGAVAAGLLLWAYGTGAPPNAPDTNAGPSVQTQPATPTSPLEPATRSAPGP
jgi:hypothetical protein